MRITNHGKAYTELEFWNGEATCRLEGELNFLTVGPVRKYLLGELEARSERIVTLVLDLEQVALVDSTALALIVKLNKILSVRDRKLILRRPSAVVRSVLAITAIDRYISIET